MFDAFITRRIYNAGNEPDVTFFDQSIDAKKNRSKLRLKKTDTPFLHSANAHRVMKHINAIEPNKNDLPSDNESIDEYLYPTWPELFDESLFCAPRPIPKIITAEFDRRAALAAMLKDKLGAAEESRLSGCFNPSHEATSFLLFFAMFNQTIGRDWISFKKEHAHRLNNGSTCAAEASPTPWKPAVNPPWMSQMPQFQSIHQNFRPHETVVDERNEVLPYNTCCIPDCDNFCVGNVFDSAVLPWTQSNIKSESDAKRISYDEEFENELVKARSVAKAQVGRSYVDSMLFLSSFKRCFLFCCSPCTIRFGGQCAENDASEKASHRNYHIQVSDRGMRSLWYTFPCESIDRNDDTRRPLNR